MMRGAIDSHCHLTHEGMAPLGGVGAVLDRARAAGVEGMLTICCEIAREFETLNRLTDQYDNVWCTIGTHPHESGLAAEREISEEDIVRLATHHPKVIGVGETGLDYYYDYSDHPAQQTSFRKHIRAARRAGLPVVIHAREADDDLIQILTEEGQGGVDGLPPLRGVMHCFSGSRRLMEAALGMGLYVSFSGIVTFKKAGDLRDLAARVPLDRLMVETDAPYLAPEPVRGQVNEPALMIHTIRVLAQLHNMGEENMINICNRNFFLLFTKANDPQG